MFLPGIHSFSHGLNEHLLFIDSLLNAGHCTRCFTRLISSSSLTLCAVRSPCFQQGRESQLVELTPRDEAGSGVAAVRTALPADRPCLLFSVQWFTARVLRVWEF